MLGIRRGVSKLNGTAWIGGAPFLGNGTAWIGGAPSLGVYFPFLLKDVPNGSRSDITMEIIRYHMSRPTDEINPETEKYLQQWWNEHSFEHLTQLSQAIERNIMTRPIVKLSMKCTTQSQRDELLKHAMIHNAMEAVEAILPYITNKKKTLDKLFIDLKNTTELSLEMIAKLLPQCSEHIQSRYLNQMIINKNEPAVRLIITFFTPTEDHKKLAEMHWPAMARQIFQSTLATVSDCAPRYTGIIPGVLNVSVVESMKESCKHTVHRACEAAKVALRRVGLLAARTDLAPCEAYTDLDSSNEFTLSHGNPFLSDRESSRLFMSPDILFSNGMSLSKIASARWGAATEDTSTYFLPHVYQDDQNKQRASRKGMILAAGLALAVSGLAYNGLFKRSSAFEAQTPAIVADAASIPAQHIIKEEATLKTDVAVAEVPLVAPTNSAEIEACCAIATHALATQSVQQIVTYIALGCLLRNM